MERGKIIFKKLPRCYLEGRVDEHGSFLEFSSSDLENAAKIQIKNTWDIYSISTGPNENFFINSSMITSYTWMVLIEGGEELSKVGATDWPYFPVTFVGIVAILVLVDLCQLQHGFEETDLSWRTCLYRL